MENNTAANRIVWQGTVDNMELSGQPNGDQQPMRVVEDADGRLMTEYAFSQLEDGEIIYDDSNWIADYQIRFRDMQPPISKAFEDQMIADGLLDHR